MDDGQVIEIRPPSYVSHEQVMECWAREMWPQRVEATLAFMDETPEPIGDVGDPNPFARELEKRLQKRVNPICGVDFDREPIPGKWKTIICSHVIEHLLNPEFALREMRRALLPDGVIYLFYPQSPHFLWGTGHFHEIDHKRLGWVAGKSGLNIQKAERVPKRRKWYWHLQPGRPMIRFFVAREARYKLRANRIQGHDRTTEMP